MATYLSMAMMPSLLLAMVGGDAEGFQQSASCHRATISGGVGFGCGGRDLLRGTAAVPPPTRRRRNLPRSSSSSSSSSSDTTAAATAATTTSSPLSKSEIASLFRLLSDDVLLHDPSRGTCCRNGCSGCAYLDPLNGNFVYDEYVAGTETDDDPLRPSGWLAPYVSADFGDRVHASSWGRILFPETTGAAEEEDGDPRGGAPPPPPLLPAAAGCWRWIDSHR